MNEFFQTLLEKAKDIRSIDDIFALAKEYKEYFEKIKGKIDLGSLGGLFKK